MFEEWALTTGKHIPGAKARIVNGPRMSGLKPGHISETKATTNAEAGPPLREG
jgi:hypothetical protein